MVGTDRIHYENFGCTAKFPARHSYNLTATRLESSGERDNVHDLASSPDVCKIKSRPLGHEVLKDVTLPGIHQASWLVIWNGFVFRGGTPYISCEGHVSASLSMPLATNNSHPVAAPREDEPVNTHSPDPRPTLVPRQVSAHSC